MRAECAGPAGGRVPARSANGPHARDPVRGRRPARSDAEVILLTGKAGPGTIAEPTCCGTPLLLTAHIPGQEKGNAEIVTSAGAGLWVPGVRELVAEIGRLRRDRGAINAMGAASARLGRPDAGADIARLIADLIPASATAVRAGSCARL